MSELQRAGEATNKLHVSWQRNELNSLVQHVAVLSYKAFKTVCISGVSIIIALLKTSPNLCPAQHRAHALSPNYNAGKIYCFLSPKPIK